METLFYSVRIHLHKLETQLPRKFLVVHQKGVNLHEQVTWMNNSLREQKKTYFYGHSKMPEPKPIIKMSGYYYLLELSDTLSLPRHKASSAVCLQICSSEHFVCISNLLHLIMNPSGYKLYIHFYFVPFYIFVRFFFFLQ